MGDGRWQYTSSVVSVGGCGNGTVTGVVVMATMLLHGRLCYGMLPWMFEELLNQVGELLTCYYD